MRLRAKLLTGIQVILLLQILVTGGFTLRTLRVQATRSTQTELVKDWERVRSSIESLKHTLYTDIHQLIFFLQDPRSSGAPVETLRGWIRYFISLTEVDRALLLDGWGKVLVDEWSGLAQTDSLAPGRIDPTHFRFPRNEFITTVDGKGAVSLFLVTGTALDDGEGGVRRLYLITNIDKARTDAINEKTGANIAFIAENRLIACSVGDFNLDPEALVANGSIAIGNHPYEMFPGVLSWDDPRGIYLVSLRSLLPEQLTVRAVLLSYLTAFIITLAASLFLATGITVLVVSPFSRLSQWLHAYMSTGAVGTLDIQSHDEVGFLASAFHTMITTLIGEKHVISEQLEQIRFLNAYAQSIMNDIKAAIIVAGADGSIEFSNTYFLELTGTSFEELEGKGLSGILSRYFHVQESDGGTEDIPIDRDAVIEGLTLERPPGEPLHFTAKITPVRLTGGRMGSLIVLEDITTSQRLWEKMMIADRVTSLGILSAGMAHEINNPLGSILSHVKYLKAVEREHEKMDSLSWIESETNRIAAIVARIRAYTAPQPRSAPSADLNQVVRQTMDMLKLTLEERRLSIDASLEEGLPLVLCSADELKQVILNIVLNASQASADGGTIAISTCAVDGDGRVRLRVVDRGSGIEPAHMRSIFNPFFTTKGAKEGSGLGLSICYMIVKKAGGEIRVRSAPRRGTEIEVTLNVHERAHH